MKTTPISKKKRHPSGVKNELMVLKLVCHFGALRATEIARAGWQKTTENSAMVSAGRVLERLRAEGELEAGPNASGWDSYTLTKAGAARLQAEGFDADAKYPESMVTGLGFWHRALGARYLIERFVQGHRVWGEHAIEKGRSPACRPELLEFCGKLPDGFVETGVDEDGSRLYDWIEVEGSVKGKHDIAAMAKVALKAGQPMNTALTEKLSRVVIAYDDRKGHEARLLKGIEAYLETLKDPADRARVVNTLVFVRCKVKAPLHWVGMEEVKLVDLVGVQAPPAVVEEGTYEDDGDYGEDEVDRWEQGRLAMERAKKLLGI